MRRHSVKKGAGEMASDSGESRGSGNDTREVEFIYLGGAPFGSCAGQFACEKMGEETPAAARQKVTGVL